MFSVGIDISKFKHDCTILSDSGEVIRSTFTFKNHLVGFEEFLNVLHSLDHTQEIRIGFEATAHYAFNFKRFLEKAHHSFMEFNPILISKFLKSHSLRRTKTDAIDSKIIAQFLMTVEYKPYPIGFYHMYSLKSLTRLRDKLVKQRSLHIVQLTNLLDHTFPEFKPFFHNRFGATALYLLEHYGSALKMSRLNAKSYTILHNLSRGHFTMSKLMKLKQLAKDSIGESNSIFELELKVIIDLYKTLQSQVDLIEHQITELIHEVNPHLLSIPGIGPLSAAVIWSEYGDLARFSSPNQMLSFAGLEPGHFQSGQSEFGGHMVKHGSSHLRFTLMNVCIPLINNNFVFAEYYTKKRNEGKPHRVALSHLVKKLIRVIYHLEKHQIDFNPLMLK